MFYDYPGSLRIEGGKTMTLAEGRTWSVKRINSWGDFTNNGTLSGTGSISFAGRLPGGVYTNDTWTGTVAISNVATATPLNLHLYSGTNSTVQLTAVGGTSAYLPSGNVTAGRIVLESSEAASALALTDGYSTGSAMIRELAGSGAFSQGNNSVYPGLTINVMTNFTGTFNPANMVVTFGTTRRAGNEGGAAYNAETMRRLYIDPDANVSVPAGFALWSPTKVFFNGPVNFTTDNPNAKNIILFSGIGSDVQFDANAAIRINGTPVEFGAGSRRILMIKDGNLVLQNRKNVIISIRGL